MVTTTKSLCFLTLPYVSDDKSFLSVVCVFSGLEPGQTVEKVKSISINNCDIGEDEWALFKSNQFEKRLHYLKHNKDAHWAHVLGSYNFKHLDVVLLGVNWKDSYKANSDTSPFEARLLLST